MANIKDVSKLSGVSVATVSRVINKKGCVNKETENKVLKAMKMLNYTPSDVARRLAGMKSNTIGLIVPDILNPFFPEIARSVEDAANSFGYNVILCNTDNCIDKEKQYFDMLLNKQVDGIIICSSASRPDELIKIINKGMPVVLIDNEFEGHNITTITSNNYEGGKLATEHLIECGCKKVAHIAGDVGRKSIKSRYNGYNEICNLHNNLSLVVETKELTPKSGYDKTKELMKKYEGIDGIFAANDTLAIGCYKALKDLGYRVPEDVKIIGYDGLTANTDYFELSSVRQKIYSYGKLGVEILIKKIEGKVEEEKTFLLDVSLVKRKSTIGSK